MKLIRQLLESTKYMTIVAVLALLVAALAALVWGVVKTGQTAISLLADPVKGPSVVEFIEVIDIFLIAVSIYVFALAIYELFIGKLNLPDWLVFVHFDDLKQKLVSLLVLIIGITFLKNFAESKDMQGSLLLGVAGAVMAGALIAFIRSAKHERDDEQHTDEKTEH